MSYNDPYAGGQHGHQYNQGGYEFNPYNNPQAQIPQSPPSSSGAFTPARSGSKHVPAQSLSGPFVPYHDDPNPFDANPQRRSQQPRQQEFVDYTAGGASFKDIKDYRSHYQGNLWTKGSRVGCCGRFFCCTLLIGVYIFLSVVACLALWLRPPSVEIGDPFVNTTNTLSIQNGNLAIPLGLNITVNNPMYLAVDIKDLTVDLTYPVSGSPNVGNGTITNVNLASNKETNFTLPIDLEASLNSQGAAVLQDIVNNCGSSGGGRLNVDANIHIKLSALSVPVSFSISRSLNFGCPAFAQDAISQISSIIGGLFS